MTTADVYCQLSNSWFEWSKIPKNQRNERFGQYLVNKGVVQYPNQTIFYETDDRRAFDMATDILLQSEKNIDLVS